MWFPARIPWVLTRIYSRRTWNGPASGKDIFLTFDDGPIPEVTPWVIEQLAHYGAKATFFCIGQNVKKYPQLLREILRSGHSIGNHTDSHLNGWLTSTEEYLEDVELAEIRLRSTVPGNAKRLFRPPYGKLKVNQAKELRKKGYEIIMWDILSKDFDKNTTPENCIRNVLQYSKRGSIIVFHDSLKAWPNLQEALPSTLEYFSRKKFNFKSL